MTSAAIARPRLRDRLATPVLRGARTPWFVCAVIVWAALVGLGLDAHVAAAWQPVLGLCAWIILAGLLAGATNAERAQTLIVVVVATFFEIVGSVWWGAYVYRHGNLPTFVPPGHGMVYLFGLRLTQTTWGRNNPQLMVRIATVGVLGWGLVGLTLLERRDVAGAIGAVILAGFLRWGRAPATYAGVFLYVTYLELYGTAIGTWFWLPRVPGIDVPNGNPPSGIAGGYVFFDMAALALAPFALQWARAVWSRRPRAVDGALPVEAAPEPVGRAG